MKVISDRDQILEVLEQINKSSLLRIDKSYYNDHKSIHCVLLFNALSIINTPMLYDIEIDQSLISNSSHILINLKSSLDLSCLEVEMITNAIFEKSNGLDYHINWQVDFDYSSDKFDLALIFVE